jgi:hypothetical protein
LSSSTRPSGVKILATLQILLGVLIVLGGILLLSVGLMLPEAFPHVRFFFGRSAYLGFILIFLALIDFILAYGLWVGKRWAWTGTLVRSNPRDPITVHRASRGRIRFANLGFADTVLPDSAGSSSILWEGNVRSQSFHNVGKYRALVL